MSLIADELLILISFAHASVLSMVQFLDSYDPPLRGLQDDLNFVSPRIGEVCAPPKLLMLKLLCLLKDLSSPF
jgi:hypothetical protein